MPPYWDNKALTTTYPNPTRYFIFNLLVIYLIFIENKCFYNVIWNLKNEEKKKYAKRRNRIRVDRVKMSTTHTLPSAPLELMTVNSLL